MATVRLAEIADLLGASSWWDTNGAIALITGFTAVAGVAVGLLLRPWVEAQVRRGERLEITMQQGRELVADLSLILMGGRGFVETVIDRFERAIYWVNDDGVVNGPTIDHVEE